MLVIQSALRGSEKPPPCAGVSTFLGKKCLQPLLYFCNISRRKHIHISFESLNAHQSQLRRDDCYLSSNRVSTIIVEIKFLLLRGERRNPKHLIVELLDNERGTRKVISAPILLKSDVFANCCHPHFALGGKHCGFRFVQRLFLRTPRIKELVIGHVNIIARQPYRFY